VPDPTLIRSTDVIAYPRRWAALAVLCLSLVVIGLDNTVLNVALPTLQRDLGASASELQWIVDSYMLVLAGLLLTAGALGDAFGRKRALSAGLLVFAGGSGLSALAETPEWLIASRALMGVGAALMMPSTLSILTAMFPPGERAKAIGIWAGASGNRDRDRPADRRLADRALTLGLDLPHQPADRGPRLGRRAHGRARVARPAAPPARRRRARTLDRRPRDAGVGDHRGAGTRVDGRGGPHGVRDRRRAARRLPLVGDALLAADVRGEPVPRPALLGVQRTIALAFFAMVGSVFFLTQYLQAVLDYTALEAGVWTMPVAIGVVIAAPSSARALAAFGLRAVVAAGMAVLAAGLLLLAQADTSSPVTLVLAAELLMGVGIGAATAPATDSIMGSLPLAHASVGSAVNDTTRVAGGALGVAVLGSVLSSVYRADMDQVAMSGLPGPARDLRSDSLLGALTVAEQAGGTVGAHLSDVAQAAFVSGMHSAVLVSATIAMCGCLVALAFLPRRSAPERHHAVVAPDAVRA
jgi:predicted MFS family arabinose efflux permease